MHATSRAFKSNVHEALVDETLQKALGIVKRGFQVRRAEVVAKLPEFEALREAGRAIKNHTLAHLDFYLERFEAKVTERGEIGRAHV